jgi:ribosomal protein S18 acetylase RimI-like enzyme
MIDIRTTWDGITPEDLTGFFVGWPTHPDPKTHLRILRGSFAVSLAVDSETDAVVGFATAISDGVISAYIPLLEVLPEYQKQGIGKQLVEALLGQLEPLYMIDLVCDPALEAWYRPLGFTALTGMAKRNYGNQTGVPD